MPQATDLMGVGMSPYPAEQLGNNASTLVCAGTSSQANAAKILSKNVELTAAGSTANGALLQSTALIGSPHFFFCSTSTSAIVYPPSGDYMNGSQNAGVTVAQNKGVIIWKYKVASGAGYWASVTTA